MKQRAYRAHGANRLGTNSLLDLVVFGRAAALRAKDIIKKGANHRPLSKDAADLALSLDRLRTTNAFAGRRRPRRSGKNMQRAPSAERCRRVPCLQDVEGRLWTRWARSPARSRTSRSPTCSLIFNTDLIEAA